MRGFKTVKTAYGTINGFEMMRAFRKGQAATFSLTHDTGSSQQSPLKLGARRVGAEDFSPAPLTEPDMRARIRLFGSIDQNASVSWADTCGWLISCHKAVSEAIRPVNQDGG